MLERRALGFTDQPLSYKLAITFNSVTPINMATLIKSSRHSGRFVRSADTMYTKSPYSQAFCSNFIRSMLFFCDMGYKMDIMDTRR